jgi:hypothetical protein
MTVVSMTGGEWSPEQVHREPGLLVPIEDVVGGTPVDDLAEVLVVGRFPDGTLYLAGSHNSAYSALLAAQAHHVIVRTAEIGE